MSLKTTLGFYGYIIVLASFVMQAVGWGIFNSIGLFFNPIMAEFDWPRTAVAGAVSTAIFISGLASIPLGRLNDRLGPRLIMALGGVMLATGYLLMSGVESLGGYYFYYGLLIGIGISGTDVVLLSTTARWFSRLRGRMSGVIKAGTGTGMFLVPFLVHWLIRSFGWRTAMTVLGLIIAAVFLFFSQLLVRDPARKGLRPDGDRRPEEGDDRPVNVGLTFRQALNGAQLWLICTSCFIFYGCAMTIVTHIVPHAIDLGIDASEATMVLSTLGGASIAGRFVMGFACDSTGNKVALAICFSLLIAALAWLLAADRLWMLVAFALVYGFAHGGFFAILSPLVAEFFGTLAHGVILGLVLFISTAGASLGPLAAGYVFDVGGSYTPVWVALPLLGLVGLGTTLLFRPTIDPDQAAP